MSRTRHGPFYYIKGAYRLGSDTFVFQASKALYIQAEFGEIIEVMIAGQKQYMICCGKFISMEYQKSCKAKRLANRPLEWQVYQRISEPPGFATKGHDG